MDLTGTGITQPPPKPIVSDLSQGPVRIVSEVDSTVVPSSLVKAASARLSGKPWIPQGTRIKQTLDEASFSKASRIRILCARKVAETF